MQRTLIKNGTLYTPTGPLQGWLLLENGRITAIGSGPHPECSTQIDAHNTAVLPGFIDLHVHGAVGHETMQATPESLHAMAQFFASVGVTSFLAATLTESSELITRAVENIAACMGPIKNGATLLGAYLEGPYISVRAKGAHKEHYIRKADPAEYMPWFATGAVKQVTVAPECDENMQLIKDCVTHGIMPTIGHTVADYQTVCAAIELGAHQATHTFNTMSPLHHRTPGTVGAVLTHDALCCELIADNVHVHPAALKLAARAKGIGNIVLVTDGEIGTGMNPGFYDFARSPVNVTHCGVYLPNGTLAGSTLTMNKALQNFINATGLSLADAWPTTSYNAARQLGLEHTIGTLAVGYDADIVLLNPDDYSVAMTICKGVITYTSNTQ